MTTTRRKFKQVHHYDNDGDAHFLTFSCYQGRRFLSRERTCIYLVDAIQQARAKHPFDLWAYVFMPNHVHLLVWPQEGCLISDILHSIKQSVSRKAVFWLREHNPSGLRYLATGQKHTPYRFWQDGGGHDTNLRERQELLSRAQYIHANPIRKELVEYAGDWPWSSARDWLGEGHGPIPLDLDSFPR